MTQRGAVGGVLSWVSCACIVVLTAGCTSTTQESTRDRPTGAGGPAPAGQLASTSGQGLTIEYQSQPDPPTAGDNAIEVTVKAPDGSPVTDATVTSVFSMPPMPSMNMPPMRVHVALAHVSDGRYRGTGELSMDGTWNVAVTVTRAGQEVGVKKFSIVAK